MFLELYWCEHQLCGFAIQSQLFWESLNWLPGCPTNICTGCVLKCFGRYLRNGALNSDSWYVYHIVGNACMQIYLYNLHKQLNNTSLLLVCVDIIHHQDKKLFFFYLYFDWQAAGHQQAGQPLLIGWAPGKGQANARGTLAPTEALHWSKLWEKEGRVREWDREKKWDVIQSVHLSVMDCKQKVALCPLAVYKIHCDHQPAVSLSATKNYTLIESAKTLDHEWKCAFSHLLCLTLQYT